MRVLLVWPKARTDPEWGGDLGAIAEPLALEYLAAGLRLAGHQPQVLDLRLHPEGLHAAIEEFEPDVVGVTASPCTSARRSGSAVPSSPYGRRA